MILYCLVGIINDDETMISTRR